MPRAGSELLRTMATVGAIAAGVFRPHAHRDSPRERLRAAVVWTLAALRAAFDEVDLAVDDALADAQKVWWRWTLRGTPTAARWGPRPGGRRATVPGMSIFRVADGKVAEVWQATGPTNWQRPRAPISPLGLTLGPDA
jgi:hypothetical protein